MSQPPPPASPALYWQQLRKPLELEVARGCLDTAIVGAGIGVYARLWAQRMENGNEEDRRLALSIARGLRDYAEMPVAERKRRAIAAVDLLRQREAAQAPAAPPAAPKRKAPAKAARGDAPAPPRERGITARLPAGRELLEMSIELLAPRAQWPKLLASKLQLYSVRDLLYHIPRDWVAIIPIPELQDGTRAAVVGTVARRESDRLKSQKSPHPLYKYTLTILDGTWELWVSAITMEPTRPRGGKQSWSLTKLPFQPGQRIFALGRIDRTGKIIELRMEDIFAVPDEEAALFQPGARVPIYPLTAGVYQNQVHRAVLHVLAALGAGDSANAVIDPLPAQIRAEFALLTLVEALYAVHRPASTEQYEMGRRRLAFEEFLIPQLLLAQRHWAQRHTPGAAGPVLAARESLLQLADTLAPFTPTSAQLRVLSEIEDDLRSPHPMNRMIQGDVGSGKTFLAAVALAFVVRSGMQAAIMAPTEILAEQLYLVLTRLLAPLAIQPVLLTGSVGAAERRAALDGLAAGRIPIAVGTHALIQEGVEFKDLGLAVIDEQHRFGVTQRATLRGKGGVVNTLVMTATPIPRSLALTMYGDLDLSVLDGLPPGRHPVATRWLPAQHVQEAYADIRAQVAAGRQAYVVCPLVEQSDMLQADAAVEMAAELQRVFPELRVGLLHGRMRPEEKDAAMEAFRNGATHVLACTTVIEVGVDVANATVMIIQNAERFGLAQLHQLRGRVGRSQHPSTCYLITQARVMADDAEFGESPAKKRLQIMLEEQDGFKLAEADLAIRGPGDYLGSRQSGLLEYQIAHILRDGPALEQARQAAHAIIADDPHLAAPALAELRQRTQHLKAKLDQFRE